MNDYKITLLNGDGIGPEIVNEAIKVLNIVSEKYKFHITYEHADLGGVAIDKYGVPLPDKTIITCKNSDSVLLGAVGGPKWDNLESFKRPEAGLLGIRKELGLFANLRPIIIFPPLLSASPIKKEIIGPSLNIMIVRELTGGIYFGKHRTITNDEDTTAYDTEIYSTDEIKRIATTAFNLAMKRSKKLCSIDKANVLESSKLWRKTVNEISKEYPQVELNHMYIDNCAMQLIKNPNQFDVILTSNMFGDIISDEASMISGSIGILPSASLGKSSLGLYEPIHGSAPDIAGLNIANPLAAILSVSMMLKYSLNQINASYDIKSAINEVLKEYRTPDIYVKGTKKVTCCEMGTIICNKIKNS